MGLYAYGSNLMGMQQEDKVWVACPVIVLYIKLYTKYTVKVLPRA